MYFQGSLAIRRNQGSPLEYWSYLYTYRDPVWILWYKIWPISGKLTTLTVERKRVLKTSFLSHFRPICRLACTRMFLHGCLSKLGRKGAIRGLCFAIITYDMPLGWCTHFIDILPHQVVNGGYFNFTQVEVGISTSTKIEYWLCRNDRNSSNRMTNKKYSCTFFSSVFAPRWCHLSTLWRSTNTENLYFRMRYAQHKIAAPTSWNYHPS